jgi:prepilin-type N-terminal cleavage/methylation domain-containing protein
MFFSSHKNSTQSGFSLIELLVVLGIIGLLVTVAAAAFSESRAQTRDKVRMTSLKELQLAIEQFKAQNGVYPLRGCGVTGADEWTSPGPGAAGTIWYNTCDQYIVGLVPDYIAKLPTDPVGELEADRGFLYQTNADRSAYKVLVYTTVESLFITGFGDAFARCPAAVNGPCTNIAGIAGVYAVYSPGAEDW